MTQTDEQLREWRAKLDPHRPDSAYIGALIDEVLELRSRKTPATRQIVNLSKAMWEEAEQECRELMATSARIRNAALDEAAKVARGSIWMPGKYRYYRCEVGDEDNLDAGNWAVDSDYSWARDTAANRILAIKTPEGEDG